MEEIITAIPLSHFSLYNRVCIFYLGRFSWYNRLENRRGINRYAWDTDVFYSLQSNRMNL